MLDYSKTCSINWCSEQNYLIVKNSFTSQCYIISAVNLNQIELNITKFIILTHSTLFQVLFDAYYKI